MSETPGYTVRVAVPSESPVVIALVNEAAAWLEARGIPLWTATELEPRQMVHDVEAGYYVLAFDAQHAVGVMRFTWVDEEFWPEARDGEAGYVHRLAVRRTHAGRQVPRTLLDWAAQQVGRRGRPWLRLDCEARRPKLRALYEGLGFVFHSEHTLGELTVARYQRQVGAGPARPSASAP